MQVKITPNCRYGHGDLAVMDNGIKKGAWGFMNAYNPNLSFTGNLYVCLKCGYTEFFDDEVALTEANRAKK